MVEVEMVEVETEVVVKAADLVAGETEGETEVEAMEEVKEEEEMEEGTGEAEMAVDWVEEVTAVD